MLAYTFARLTNMRAVIVRDFAGFDDYGAPQEPNWRPHVTVPCLLWWDRSSGVRSAERTYVSVAREVAVSQGGLMVPFGTDVTEADRVAQILNFDQATQQWVVGIEGDFDITAVLNQQDHMELSVFRAHLGA